MQTFDEYAKVVRKNDNTYNFTKGRGGYPTADDLLTLIDDKKEEPNYRRTPIKLVANIDDETMTEVETWANRWDLSKSRAMELLLRIALGDLDYADRHRSITEEQSELEFEENQQILELTENLQ